MKIHKHAYNGIKMINSYQTISKMWEYLTKQVKSKHTWSITQQINEGLHIHMQYLRKLKNIWFRNILGDKSTFFF